MLLHSEINGWEPQCVIGNLKFPTSLVLRSNAVTRLRVCYCMFKCTCILSSICIYFPAYFFEATDFNEEFSYEYLSQESDWKNIRNQLTSQPGINRGLCVMLDPHTDLLAEFSISSDFKGFTAAVIPQSDFPLTSQRGFEIKPGHTNMVALTALKIDANENIRVLKLEDRKCRFSNENNIMKLHKQYSQANCLFECSLFHAQNKSGSCTPWFLEALI